jgi:hypothetical protein
MLQQRRDPSIKSVWLWFEFQKYLIGNALASIIASFRSGGGPKAGATGLHPYLVDKTPAEVEEFFEDQREQLEFVTMLDLLATVEAILRTDLGNRVAARKKDRLSTRFVEINRNAINDARTRSDRRPRIRLDDILDAMAEEQIKVSEFRGALNLRYWRPNLGQGYTPEAIFDICEKLVNSIPA